MDERPVIQMKRPTIQMRGAVVGIFRAIPKGTPRHVFVTGDQVEVWMDAPTGDSSDSIILRIPCTSVAEADGLVRVWEEAWDL
jgi:hypothetical protein